MIKQTKVIDGKEVVLNLISLKGKTCITREWYDEEVKPLGVTIAALKEEGIEVTKVEGKAEVEDEKEE